MKGPNERGFLFPERRYADLVAIIMARMTGEVCMILPRGEIGFLVIRNNGSGMAIA